MIIIEFSILSKADNYSEHKYYTLAIYPDFKIQVPKN